MYINFLARSVSLDLRLTQGTRPHHRVVADPLLALLLEHQLATVPWLVHTVNTSITVRLLAAWALLAAYQLVLLVGRALEEGFP